MNSGNIHRKYRTTRDILIPKGTNVVFVARMKQEVTRVALAHVRVGADAHYEFFMAFDDMLALGWVEEVVKGPKDEGVTP